MYNVQHFYISVWLLFLQMSYNVLYFYTMYDKKVIEKCEEKLKGNGRLLIRKSGTQPLIRVMAESEDPKIMENVVNDIVAEIQKYV